MNLAAAALIIMFGNVASRLLGVAREQVIAGLFGASAATDAFTVADRIPRSVYDLIIGGMISALVPVFSDYADDADPGELWHLLSTVLSLLAIILTAAVLLLVVLAPQVVAIFGYGFTGEVQELTVLLVRVALPVVIFLGLAGVLTAVLYARRRFLAPALASVSYNAGIIAVAWLLHERLGVISLVLGVLAGGLGQLLIQLIAFGPPKYRPAFDLQHPAVKRIARLYVPVGLGVAITSVGVAIDANLASRTGEGSLSAMRFATTLVQFPLGLVATALSFAILPTLSRQVSFELRVPASESSPSALHPRPTGSVPQVGAPSSDLLTQTSERETGNSDQAFKATLIFGIKLAILGILPAAAGLVMLRYPLIQVLFERGQFDADDTARTALAFLAYSPGLVAAAVDQLLIAAFYARKDTATPNLVAGAGVVVYLIVGLSLIRPLGMAGLALANSAQLIAHMILLWVLLSNRVGGLGVPGLWLTILKAVIATAAMAGAIALAGRQLGGLDPGPTGLTSALYVAVYLALGATVYGLALVVLRVQEAGQVAGLVRDRLARR